MLDIYTPNSLPHNPVDTQQIWWAPLPHCPEDQLTKPGHSTDAGWDIRLAEDVLVENYEGLDFDWEPEEPATSDCLKGVLDYIDWDIDSYAYGNYLYVNYGDLRFREGREEIYVQRKKYKPILAKTGILINPQFLSWNGLHLRSSAPKFGVALANNLGVIDFTFSNELLIQLTLQPGAGATYLKRGERIAQLIPTYQFSNVELVKKEVSEMRSPELRGGHGSTGTK